MYTHQNHYKSGCYYQRQRASSRGETSLLLLLGHQSPRKPRANYPICRSPESRRHWRTADTLNVFSGLSSMFFKFSCALTSDRPSENIVASVVGIIGRIVLVTIPSSRNIGIIVIHLAEEQLNLIPRVTIVSISTLVGACLHPGAITATLVTYIINLGNATFSLDCILNFRCV